MSTEPVLIGSIISVLFSIFGTALATYGITEDDANEVAVIIGGIVSAIVVGITWWKTRSKVTPVSDPHNNEGEALVPEVQAA